MTNGGGEKLSCGGVPAAVSNQSGSRSEAEEAENAKTKQEKKAWGFPRGAIKPPRWK